MFYEGLLKGPDVFPGTFFNIRSMLLIQEYNGYMGFPGGAVVKNPPANAGDMGSSPGPGRSHMPQSN